MCSTAGHRPTHRRSVSCATRAPSATPAANTRVLEQVIVDVTDQPFPELMRQLVLDPLGMANSSYGQRFRETRSESTARGADSAGDGRAGLWTTAGDLARLAIEIQGTYAGDGRLLSKGTIHQVLSPGPDERWRLGLTLVSAHKSPEVSGFCRRTVVPQPRTAGVGATTRDCPTWPRGTRLPAHTEPTAVLRVVPA